MRRRPLQIQMLVNNERGAARGTLLSDAPLMMNASQVEAEDVFFGFTRLAKGARTSGSIYQNRWSFHPVASAPACRPCR